MFFVFFFFFFKQRTAYEFSACLVGSGLLGGHWSFDARLSHLGSDGYIDINAAFEEATGIHVNYMTFDSNETMYTKLKTGGTTFDVIIPSDYMIAKLISEDMLEPLDFANIPNYAYIDENFRDQAYDPENTYSVPYTWGTVGLIYNRQYVSDEDAESWSCL